MADERIERPVLRPAVPELLGAIHWEQTDTHRWSLRWLARGKLYRDSIASLPLLGLGIARLVVGEHIPDVLVCEQPFSPHGRSDISVKVSRSAGLLEAGIALGVERWHTKPPASVYATVRQWRPAAGIPASTNRDVAKKLALALAPKLLPSLKPVLSALGAYDDLAEAALLSFLGLTVWQETQTQDQWLEALKCSYRPFTTKRPRKSKLNPKTKRKP
jgi:hypothetical protein